MTFRQAIEELPYFFLLESVEGGRYSIAGWNPSEILIINDGMKDDPLEHLRRRLKESPSPSAGPDLPFNGGWMGYLGYEAYSLTEPRVPARTPRLIPKGVFGWYENFYVYDHKKGKEYHVETAQTGGARPRFLAAGLACRQYLAEATGPVLPSSKFHSSVTKPQYLAAIERIQSYLQAGDVYQVNLSQKFTCPASGTPYDLYTRLRKRSPAPYSAFFNLGEAQILSSSPECFLEVTGRDVTTHPIKGTRKRGGNPHEDRSLRHELLTSEKDQAELLMITDLERNDLGKVCEPGSITVPVLRDIQGFQHVHHAIATIRGRLQSGKDVIDLIRATFPGGSITGAPKIRAMQIIHELEKDPREVYCGAMGFLGKNGKAAFNIAIRTMILKDQRAHFWSGGGIVADSDPEAEYDETLVKARGFFELFS